MHAPLTVDASRMIESLSNSDLAAGCPNCGGEFRLSEALLFDGRGEFPGPAEAKRQEMLEALKAEEDSLLKRQQRATTTSESLATSVGVGKIIEKVLPAHRNFGLPPADCRFLGDPIDMIIFDGVSKNRVDRITFLDVKTGKSPLTPKQRQIRDTIEDHGVKWRSY